MGCVQGPELGEARLFFFLPPCQEEWFSAQNFSAYAQLPPTFPGQIGLSPPAPPLWVNKSRPLSLLFALWLMGVCLGWGLVHAEFENLNSRLRRLSREGCGRLRGWGWGELGRARVPLGLGGRSSHMTWR